MKIVIANRHVFPDQSATGRMVSGLAFALARRGFEVTAIASRAMIVCPTATMASYISDRGFPDGQVFVMHHSSDGEEIYPVAPAFSQSVEFRGIVPRSEMAKEYEWAGVFPLPSICDGSATAIYEALAAGLPVICTENAGGAVRDGLEGFIVPICNGEAIAKAIADLTEHPGLRAAMCESAVDRAAEFTVKRFGERLLDALSVLPAQRRTPTEQAA